MTDARGKYDRLVDLMRVMGRVVVAFSGGVDSTLLARAARDAVGEGALLLAAYSLGLGIPFLFAAMFSGAFMRFLSKFRVHLGRVEKVIGGLLVVAGLLFVGAYVLGAGTLKDLALALFVGIGVGTYSSIFIATPVLAQLKEREPAMQALAKRVSARRAGARPTTSSGEPVAATVDRQGAGGAATADAPRGHSAPGEAFPRME